jgi:hypothetical protein
LRQPLTQLATLLYLIEWACGASCEFSTSQQALSIHASASRRRLIRAIPSLAPATFTRSGEPPALRVATLREQMLDCPQCLLRRDGAFIDTRLFPLRMACLWHRYWLYRDGAGRRIPPVIVLEIASAQKRLERLAARYGEDAAVRAYDLARYYLREDWRKNGSPFWESALADRWYQRAEAAASTMPRGSRRRSPTG